jgi:hypothetical protein
MAAAVIAGAATPALATESDIAFSNFQKVCGAPSAEYPGVMAAADSDGWANSPVTGDTMPKVTISQKGARAKTVGATNLILLASQGLAQTPGGAVTVSDCTVRSDQGDLAQVAARTQAWLGIAPTSPSSDRMTFRFTREDGKATAPADQDAAVAGAGLQILTLSRSGGNLTMDLIKLKK